MEKTTEKTNGTTNGATLPQAEAQATPNGKPQSKSNGELAGDKRAVAEARRMVEMTLDTFHRMPEQDRNRAAVRNASKVLFQALAEERKARVK